SRRTFLKGAGVTLALPFLDAMVPAFGSGLHPAGQAPVRLIFVYVPNGAIMQEWTPKTEGPAFEFTPILEPLAPLRDRLLVLTGLAHRNADPLPGEQGAGHARASAAFLTGTHAKEGKEAPKLSISVDQVAAAELGKSTPLPSLELALD